MTQHQPRTDREREQIVFGETIDWGKGFGGIARFHNENAIPVATVRTLLEKRYLNPHDRQNESPTARELAEFAEDVNPALPGDVEVMFEGYIVRPDRDDARITLEGFVIDPALNDHPDTEIPEDVRDTITARFTATEQEVTPERVTCWWD